MTIHRNIIGWVVPPPALAIGLLAGLCEGWIVELRDGGGIRGHTTPLGKGDL